MHGFRVESLILGLSVPPVIGMTAFVSNGVNPDVAGKLLEDDEVRKPVHPKRSFTSVAQEGLPAWVSYDGGDASLDGCFKGRGCLEGTFRIICDCVVQLLNGFQMENDRFHPSQIFAANLGKDFLGWSADHGSRVYFLRPSVEFLIPSLFISRIRFRRRGINRVKQPGGQVCSVRSFKRFQERNEFCSHSRHSTARMMDSRESSRLHIFSAA
jgi:hypothetical protein